MCWASYHAILFQHGPEGIDGVGGNVGNQPVVVPTNLEAGLQQ
jgi:hypothetical protein